METSLQDKVKDFGAVHRSYESISKHNKVRGCCQWGGSLVVPSMGVAMNPVPTYMHTHAHTCTYMHMGAHTPQDRNAADSRVGG